MTKIQRIMSFERACLDIQESTGIDVFFCHDEPGKAEAYEDDEVLHVRKFGTRACFSVGKDDAKAQNANTRTVLQKLKMEKFIGPRTQVDETQEEEDVCPCCGAPRHNFQ